MGAVPPDLPDSATVDRIVRQALHRPARLGTTRLVCVDGPAGSGKTTLARALVEGFEQAGTDVGLFRFDEVYEDWTGLNPTLEPRVLAQVFEPLARGEVARWQRYDWHAAAFAEWHDLPPADVLVAEGCGSGALAYASYRSLLVFVQADPEVRVARGIERDGPAVDPYWRRWMTAEARHFRLNDTRAQADVVVRTD